MVRLGNICENLDNMRVPITAKDRLLGNYPYYGASGVVDYINEFIFDEDLLLVSEDGANLLARVTPIAFSIQGKAWVNNHAHVLRFANMYTQKYVERYLNKIDISRYVTGTAQPKLNQKKLNDINIPLPPLETQKQIVKTLDTAAELLALRKKQLSELDNLIKSTFYDIFGDPVTNERGWNKVPLGGLCDITSSKRIFENEYVSQGIPFYRTKEIVELSKGNIISTEIYISTEKYNDIREKFGVPHTNDILISAVGTIGTTWIVPNEQAFYFKDGNLLWIKNADTFNSIYLRFLLSILIKQYTANLTIGSAYNALTIVKVKQMLSPIPPIEFQNQFADIVTKIEEQKALVKKAIDETQYLFDSLMSRYFD